MPRDIGPDMLAHLDRRLAKGDIDHATHEARRAGVLELIRKGQAFTLEPREKILWGIVAALLIVLGIGLAAAIGSGDGSSPIGMLIVLALVVFGVNRLVYVFRH